TVILGGLVTSTFCEFLIRPGLFLRFSGTSAMALVRADETADGLDADPSPSPSAAGAAPAHGTRPTPVAAGDETRPNQGREDGGSGFTRRT
ncbi:MAG: hypothetical protein K2V38_19050, partial [Gemmataceae bacterium]|nr:hypothetical protein [Gemmataceae bacterium]